MRVLIACEFSGTMRRAFRALGPDRWKERSRTLDGIAAACAMQWGGVAEAIREAAE